MPMPPPIIVPRAPPARRFGCGVLSWVVAAFFVVLLCLTISEITYNRQRDQAFLRLKWAELRQRMLGFELLSQAQQHEALPPPINELPCVNRLSISIDPLVTELFQENAEEMGLNGDMQVHVIEVKPIPNKQSIDDAFGETNMPRQPFGPWH
ncbi:unnamed protein product [Heligmosomoides polygyrus]|uniref:Cell division protein FtsL n=1 Tax=Heligmosomoides polygyrus TaxID=6339 RepID=A0A183FKL7_HELPZ|nr:unnamed protein product [Heligmosomoides polygyrus]